MSKKGCRHCVNGFITDTEGNTWPCYGCNAAFVMEEPPKQRTIFEFTNGRPRAEVPTSGVGNTECRYRFVDRHPGMSGVLVFIGLVAMFMLVISLLAQLLIRKGVVHVPPECVAPVEQSHPGAAVSDT